MPDNNSIVRQILYEVGDGLGPFVLKKYRQYYHDEYRQKLINNVESPFSDVRPLLKDDDAILKAFDAYRWLRAITKDKQVFRDEFGPTSGRVRREFNQVNAFNFVHELLDARNTWAHSNARDQFTNDGVYRIAENAVRLMVAVGAKTQALVSEEMMRSIGRMIYGADDGETQRRQTSAEHELELANRKLEGSAVELESNRRRLTSVRQELKLSKLDLESAQLEARTAQSSVAEMSQRLKSVEKELAETNRRLKLAQNASQDGRMEQNQKRRASAGAESGRIRKIDSAKLVSSGGAKDRAGRLHTKTAGVKDFTGRNLAREQLENADLSGAIMREVDLSHANLANADLSRADLSGATLKGANLCEARLQGANLTQVNLEGATLRRARLMGATLDGAILPDGNEWTPGTNMGSFLR